jgi:hypothetical protein
MKIDTLKFDADTRTLIEAIANGFNPTEIETSLEDSFMLGGPMIEFEKSSVIPQRIMDEISTGKYSDEQMERLKSHYPTKAQWKCTYKLRWIKLPLYTEERQNLLSSIIKQLEEKFNINGFESHMISDIAVVKTFDNWSEAKEWYDHYTEFHNNHGDELYKEACKLIDENIKNMSLWFRFKLWVQEHSTIVNLPPPLSFLTASYYRHGPLRNTKKVD